MNSIRFLNEASIARTTRDIITDATITTIAELCKSPQEGHDTLWTNSSYASFR